MLNKSVAYIYSKRLEECCNSLPTMSNRASIVQDLINSYNILNNDQLLIVESLDATEDELKLFHSTSYIEFLKKVDDKELFDEYEEELIEYGLTYDCPLLKNNFSFVKAVAGSSLTGAKLLINNKCKIAINWFGGWHHAQRDSAEGFCYVNDIVISIHKLREKFEKVLYIDLDIHHGNGVQNAFEISNKVLTLSFHRYGTAFYPGSGSLEDIGSSKGKYYSINVPFKEGVNTKNYLKVFTEVFPSIMKQFKPNAIVVQCGADGLAGDEIGGANLTLETYGKCVENILGYNLHTLLLGGGGYNFPNTARLWTYLTSKIIGMQLSEDIPDESEYFTKYSPTYELNVVENNQKNFNSDEYIDHIINVIVKEYCNYIK